MQWQDVLADKSLQNLPYKIELNEKGNIEMSPASVLHSLLQGQLTAILQSQSNGAAFTELAIQTTMGVRVPDVAWGSKDYILKHKKELYASSAPEICVEIISPSNTTQEMFDKTQLFIEAGAQEVWLVTESGNISIYNKNGQTESSQFDINVETIELNI
ncbi:MAG: Uma2 family endonuclease [gamma proteobacterium symbiont of Bathyaustriella thionipta]|nr:Uma2 family endonuclease [gamma proteobacterium symbiont of Bathyaustriella thionipta]MCU7948694.1 Uma2 family endonuclease [gamma proteobacterium symbiont of Bathyaustriella thionipta]MCU7953871.1 Uma2 family endonuclease [gamma proteobacterium symbiont of Bathyaustriella thionipta]MCU7955033.1 Uma2 family endonuclease [gamma proteobacterium symbiont of Bathyaustriella thionipta]MCU7968633.1 Uma2 family endonuclease [gamma proteobacterium symbiont of Bathyaustriella thionipta]